MVQAPAFGARTLTDLATLLDLATATEMQNLGCQLWHVAFGSAPADHFRKSVLKVVRKMKMHQGCIKTGRKAGELSAVPWRLFDGCFWHSAMCKSHANENVS